MAMCFTTQEHGDHCFFFFFGGAKDILRFPQGLKLITLQQTRLQA